MHDDAGGSGGMGSLYERAAALQRRGRPEDALLLLDQLLQGDPGDTRARYARAVCLTDLGRTAEAVSQLLRILDTVPRYYRAAYRLGRLLEADGDVEGAAEAYRRVLAVTDFRDARARLRSCESTVIVPAPIPHLPVQDRGTITGVHPLGPRGPISPRSPVSGPVIIPGPPSLREQVEVHRVADRGRLVATVHLKARHLAPVLARAFLVAAALTMVAVAGGRLSPQPTPLPTTSLLLAIAWLPSFILLTVVLVKSRANSADFFEYGVNVRSGFFNRSEQFIWYYQITESPRYLRRFSNYFTGTASLCLRYNDAGESSARYVELPGIGTPEQVRQLGRYVESRTPPERLPVRGPWT